MWTTSPWASPDVVVSTGAAHPAEGETGQLKDARTSEKPILSHQKLPFNIITFAKLSFHMVFIVVLKLGGSKMYLQKI